METKFLGIDYGARRIGIAISDINKSFSFSKRYLENDGKLLSNLLEIIKRENINKIILGYPLNLRSQKTQQTLEVEKFASALKSFLKNNLLEMEIILEDERLSSSLALEYLHSSELKKKKRMNKGLLDELAAQIILQSYLDRNKK